MIFLLLIGNTKDLRQGTLFSKLSSLDKRLIADEMKIIEKKISISYEVMVKKAKEKINLKRKCNEKLPKVKLVIKL